MIKVYVHNSEDWIGIADLSCDDGWVHFETDSFTPGEVIDYSHEIVFGWTEIGEL